MLVMWARRIVMHQESRLYQMDPLSSPNELSPMHVENAPMMWMTPADMKLFLRPIDEESEDVWNKAITFVTQ